MMVFGRLNQNYPQNVTFKMIVEASNHHFCVTSVISTRSEKSLRKLRLKAYVMQRFLAPLLMNLNLLYIILVVLTLRQAQGKLRGGIFA